MSRPEAESGRGQARRRAGLPRTARALWRKVYDRDRSIWFELPLDGALRPHTPRFDARLDFDRPDRVREFIERCGIPGTCDPVELRTMQDRGHLLVGIEAGPELVGFVKIGWDRVYVLDYRIDLVLPPRSCFILDTHVLAAMRGLGAGTFAVAGTSIEMQRRGFERRISHVSTSNAAMLRTGARAGYREIGRVEYVSILGRKVFRPHPSELFAPRPAAG